ncbi:MAG TPA: HAD hydrolase-like protein [Holophaga sp.]|nr:HAD hydrolase-like protein [Holophaga sp.]
MPLCFDLDGTLGSFGGGYALLRQALGSLWGQEPTVEDLMSCKGSTDWEIVDELHRRILGTPLAEDDYERYDRACLALFQAAFYPGGRQPVVFQGIISGMTHLLDKGHRLQLVSGNTPGVLEFKAKALGLDPRVRLLGSLPHLDRASLILRALEDGPGPHLYVGDRPHDHAAAMAAGLPFLGVGDAVPGDHPILSVDAEAEHLVQAVEALLADQSTVKEARNA